MLDDVLIMLGIVKRADLSAVGRVIAQRRLAGRTVSYAIYVGGASAASSQLSSTFDEGLTSPKAIALQLLMLALLGAYLLIPWSKLEL